MRRTDLSAALRLALVKADGYSHVHALVPPPAPRRLPASGPLSAALQAAHQALGALKAHADLLPNTDLLTRTLARREAVQSSQIEGTRTQLHELLEFEATGGEGMPTDATITERYVEALELGLNALRGAGTRQALSLGLIKEMHRVLMQDGQAALTPGKYREKQAWIGAGTRIEEATFVPPPPAYIADCMRELEVSLLQYEMAEDEYGELSIIAQVAMAHAQFETIHPFADGNGRVGRLLIPLMLAAEGYPPLYVSGYLLSRRRDYYDALAAVQLQGKWAEWIIFLCQAICNAADSAIAIARDLNAIELAWLASLNDLRVDAAARRLPSLLLGYPVVTVRQVARLLTISFPAANKAIEQLVARGILTEPSRRRNRVFYAHAILERLAMP
ncbi:Fic family protein [Paraperlucidibaca baekdonensis]|uniref:Protein adenylyltransferase n=1 Tax=Paraperlucidibaca baekdonensis TaxID=748120 RepID=A0A3E0H9M9_9GAMM|nr:Fic/DOC family N-terminal domain-containing protein [Paraperlucidibaca baekdonensis]REH40385.1 Fic family protein [Paraperlucidibaca baekdonensis]